MQSGSLQGATEKEEVNTHSRGFQEKKKKRKQCFQNLENLEDWVTLKVSPGLGCVAIGENSRRRLTKHVWPVVAAGDVQ